MLVGLVAVFGLVQEVHAYRLRTQMLSLLPDDVPASAVLSRFARSQGRSAYRRECAQCHGGDMRGVRARHTPDLTDRHWLYDGGSVADIERTILYGVRSGHPKSHNLADMPAIGRLGRLTPDEIGDVSEYVLRLSHQDYVVDRAARGAATFLGRGVCFDCHGPAGEGNADWGAPAFTADVWMYGGDRTAIAASIRDGRHGVCPAFVDKLKPAEIRSIAVAVYLASHKALPHG